MAKYLYDKDGHLAYLQAENLRLRTALANVSYNECGCLGGWEMQVAEEAWVSLGEQTRTLPDPEAEVR